MPKTKAEQSFDFLVSKIIWPHFKAKGYKKSGNNFRFYTHEGWGKIVNFQKSAFYDKNHISFTINTGLYLAETEKFHCNQQSHEKFQEAMCLVRKRIGELADNRGDLWFDLNDDTDVLSLAEPIEDLFKEYVIPYLDKINSRDDILRFLVNGYRSYYTAAQIQTLYVNGYRDLARQQLKEALHTSRHNPYSLEMLRTIEQSFEN